MDTVLKLRGFVYLAVITENAADFAVHDSGWTRPFSGPPAPFLSSFTPNTGANAARLLIAMLGGREVGFPASPDDDLVALSPSGNTGAALTRTLCSWTQHATEEHRTCRPLDRGQKSTKCTSLRRALGIVGDSCQAGTEEVSPA